jgi:hypothetical protein
MDATRFFFQEGDMRRQPADLFGEFAEVLGVGEPRGRALGVLPLKEARKALDRRRFPEAYPVGVNVVLGGDVAQRFLAAQDLLDNSGFEGGASRPCG